MTAHSAPHAAGHGATDAALPDWAAGVAARVERALEALLPRADEPPARLHEAMRYAVLGGGKRIRPLLVHAAGELAAAAQAPPGPSPSALELAACAVELVHAYSLVHDDLPCMDNDTLRRGKPTVWAAYGEACAMLVGDALQALAFEALARVAEAPGAHCLAPGAASVMAGELAAAAGSRGMVGGQAIDLESVGQVLALERLRDMHRRKTGALLRAAVLLGARCGTLGVQAPGAFLAPGLPQAPDAAHALARLERYGHAVGLAFQVIDDVLDVESDTATLGKTAGKDDGQAKPTYVSAMGLEPARALAERLRDEAIAAVEPFGAPARRLVQLAHLIVSRRS